MRFEFWRYWLFNNSIRPDVHSLFPRGLSLLASVLPFLRGYYPDIRGVQQLFQAHGVLILAGVL